MQQYKPEIAVSQEIFEEYINPAVIAENVLDTSATGVFVVSAQDIAARAGLRQGDVVRAINRQAIRSTTDLDRVLRDPTRHWEIEIDRDGRRSLLRFRI